jgi:hypothetical protein
MMPGKSAVCHEHLRRPQWASAATRFCTRSSKENRLGVEKKDDIFPSKQ